MRRLESFGICACLVTLLFSANALAQSNFGWSYATFVGGSQPDGASAIVRDAHGYLYVGGSTSSTNFPVTPGSYQTTFTPSAVGATVGFVAKFTPQGKRVWATFFGDAGGVLGTMVTGVAVDAGGNVYATGLVDYGASVPITSGSPNSGVQFVAKFDPSGSHLVYSGLFGGAPTTEPRIVVDALGNAFIIGNGAGTCCGNLQQSLLVGPGGGVDDFFLAAINPQGTETSWAILIGGTDLDDAYGLTRASTGELYLTGYSHSSDFPCRGGAICNTTGGDVIVVKVDPSKPLAQSIVYAAKYGGLNPSKAFMEGYAIAVDAAGNALIAADLQSSALPTARFAFQPKSFSFGHDLDAYVFKLNPTGTAVTGGTYLTGDENTYVHSLAVDSLGNIYVSGMTDSHNFLTTAYTAVQSKTGDHGYLGGFYVKLNPSFSAISSVRFGYDGGYASVSAVALDGAGGLWGTGYTGAQFPTTSGAEQPGYHGNGDAFLLHTTFPPSCGSGAIGLSLCAPTQPAGLDGRVRFVAQAEGMHAFHNMVLKIDGLVVDGLRAQQIDSNYAIAPGNHTVTMTATDAIGMTYSKTASFSVTEISCPSNPTNPSLTICSPLNVAMVSGSVELQVTTNAFLPPSNLKLYIDGKYAGTVPHGTSAHSYAKSLSVAKGVHRFTVTGIDGISDYLYTTTIARVQ